VENVVVVILVMASRDTAKHTHRRLPTLRFWPGSCKVSHFHVGIECGMRNEMIKSAEIERFILKRIASMS
jgi:hypothetical protein